MCGIFAYIGNKENAHELVLEGLKKLEYRGYDSWGIAYHTSEEVKIYKEVGHISEAENSIFPQNTKANIAMGHTRWATHGGVTIENAHPHNSQSEEIVVIHNGIFENFQELKNKLQLKGYTFKSQTDTEVAAHLIQDELKSAKDLLTAIKEALKKLHGRYALVVMNQHTKEVIAARRGSPLIIGSNKTPDNQLEYFLASDVPAFLKHTNQVVYLDDEQLAIITPNEELQCIDLQTNKAISKRVVTLDIQEEEAEKGEFDHFMIKEIWEQKDTILRAVNQDPHKLKVLANLINNAFGTYFVGCGTAGKVGLAATYLFAKIAKQHINFAVGSEFPSLSQFITDGSLLISISQSGETADTLEAMEVAKKQGATLASIVNVESSTMARLSDITLPIKAGPEKAVASTKATTSQLALVTLLAYSAAGKLDLGMQKLIETASQINDMLNPRYEEHLKQLAEKIVENESLYIIGKSINYPIALEAAIKLQEVSYIHAEGFAAGELKHGPLALISNGTPVIALFSNDETYNDTLSNAIEVKARGGIIIGISPKNEEIFDHWIKVPDSGITSPIVNLIPIQILSYYLAILRNNNPDKPRNLAKSVTVK